MLSNPQANEPKLGRRLALVLLPLVLIPALLIGGIAYWNTQTVLQEKAEEQLETALQGQLIALEAFVIEQEGMLARVIKENTFEESLFLALSDAGDTDAADMLNNGLQLALSSLGSANSSVLFILDKGNGEIVFGTDGEMPVETFVFDQQIAFQTIPLVNNPQLSSNSIAFLSIQSLDLGTALEGSFALASVSSNARVAELASVMHSFISTIGDVASSSLIAVRPDVVLHYNQDEPPSLITISGIAPVFDAIDPTEQIQFNFVNEQGEEYLAIAKWSTSTEIALGISQLTGNLFSADPSTASILVISILLISTVAVVAIIWTTNRMLQPLSSLTELAGRMTQGDWNFRVAEDRSDELGYLAKSLNRMARELGTLYQSLESRVEDRTKQIRIASEVARAVISIPNLDDLLRQAVNLIKDRFGYDHVSIFLIDKEGNNAVLRESSSEDKEALKTVGYKLKIGSPSMVGRVTEINQPKILSGEADEPELIMDELLPGALSEVAIPLQVAGKSLGALAIQSFELEAFKTEDIEVLQTLADQLSAAIENARLAQVSTNAAERARLVSEITNQISGLADPAQVLQTTAKALHSAMGEAEIIVKLVSPSDDMEEVA